MLFDRFSGGSGKHRASLVRTGGVSLLVAAILAASVGTWSVLAGKEESKAAPAAGTLKKTARDATTGSTTTTSAGSTVNYTLQVSNRSGENATVNVTDAIGANQSYVPGSLKTPDGWPKQWSTDGGQTWTSTEPASGVTNIRVGDVAGIGDYGQGRSATALLPIQGVVTPEGFGDGWEAIFWQDRVYNIPHHRQQGVAAGLQCFNKFTGDPCPGFNNKTSYVSSTAGAAFHTGTDDLNSAYVPWAMVDQDTGRFWYPAGRGALSTANPNGSTQIGMACVDMAAGQSCGFTTLATLPRPIDISVAATNANPRITGGAIIGTRYYSLADTGNVYCFDRATSAACGGPVNALPGVSNLPNISTTNQGMLRSYDGRRVYGAASIFVSNDQPVRVYGTCLDTQTGANCPGYPVTISSATRVFGRAVNPALDSAGQVVGFCVALVFNPTQGGDTRARGWRCYGPTGQAITVPNYGVPFSGDQNLVGGFYNNSGLLLDGRVYLANSIGASSGTFPNGTPWNLANAGEVATYVCYDPATDGPCDGFSQYSSGQGTRAYTITQDPYLTDCLWELGDAGRYEVFDRFSGRPGCNSAEGRISAKPLSDLCDPTIPGSQAWRDVRLAGLTAAQYRSATVTLLDKNGNAVPGYVDRPLGADGRLLISGVPVSGDTTELTAVLRVEGIDQAAIDAGTLPIAQINWVGPEPQICYQVKVDEACVGALDAVNNDAQATFTIANGQRATQTARASLTVTGGADCPPLSLNKRIVDPPKPVPGSPGLYTISYDVLITYPTSPLPTTYDLSDRIRFGSSITVSTATIRNAVPGAPQPRPDWNGVSQPVVATDVPITSNTTHTWVVTVQFRLSTSTPPPSTLDCVLDAGESGTGTLNTATVVSNGQTLTDEDCAALDALTIDKKLVSATQTGDGTWTIEYDVTVRNPSGGAKSYDLDDKLMFGAGITVTGATVANTAPGGITTSPTWNGTSDLRVVSNQTLAADAAHTYRVKATATVPAGLTPAQGDCTLDPGEQGTGFLNRATVTSDGASLSDEDCAPPVPDKKPAVTIDKSLVSSTNTAGNTWQIVYDVTVANTGGAGKYDLSDALKFGKGITVDSATVANTAPGGITTNASWNGVAVTQIVTGQAIAAGATHVYRITATATVATTTTTTDADCELTTGETGTGFLNEATLTVDGKTTEDKDCGSPDGSKVAIDKRVVSATPGDGGQWTVSYDVTVSNTTAQPTTYDLSDTLKFGGSITVDSAAVANSAPGGIATNPSWNGTSVLPIVTGQAIAANAVHVYRVTVVATVPTTITTTQADCTLDTGETGTGFLNRATVTAGGASQSDEDCVPPTPPPGDSVTVDKRILSAENTGGDAWQVIYLVTVTNPGTGAVTYDLDDRIMFGAGITVTGQSVANTVPGSIATRPSWNGASDIRVVSGQSIAAGGTHAYRVTVTATVPSTVTAAAADCQLSGGESGTGFLNRTTLTSGGRSQSDEDCAPPTPKDAQVTVDKALTSKTKTGDTTWQVVYDVTVRDTGTSATTYDLDDALKFGQGITVNSATVANVAPGGITTNPAWNGLSVVRVVTGQAIDAGATHVYRITANATVATTTTTSSADCVLTTDESGTGFLNQAKVTAGGRTVVDEDCGDPKVDSKVTIDKRVASATQDGDGGQWTVTYDITVTNTGAAADSYDLDDRLLFGGSITVNSAAVANTTPGSITTNPAWNGTTAVRVVTAEAIAAGATHVYRVTTKATVAGTITTEEADCTLTSTEAGTGFLNRSSITVNEVTTSDEDCAPPKPPTGSDVVVEKRLVASQRLTADGWQITYDVTVRNTGAATTYDLDDRIKFGAGITMTGQTIANTTPGSITTSPTWNGGSDARVVTGQAIAANATHVYRVTVLATVPGSITTQQADCTLDAGETGTGFLNEATATSGGKTSTDDACAPPQKPDTPQVNVDKSLISATKSGDGTWQIVYDVTVRDIGTTATTYDLDDALKFGAGITVTSATVANTAPGSITTNASWNGLSVVRVVSGQAIDGGATHVYRVTANATVATTITTEAGDCNLLESEKGTGFLNRTTLTANGGTMTDEACVPPTPTPGGPVAVDKTLVSSVKGAGNTWTITYDIRVTNPGAAVTTYDLDDRLLFGGSITINSATASNTVPGSITTNPNWNGRTDIRVTTGQAITAGATDVYRVTVTATVATTITTEQGDCELTTTESGTGFLNRATATAGGSSSTDTDCSSPNEPKVAIDKRVVSATQGEGGQWTIAYDVTVTNTGGQATKYDLSDAVKFGGSITVNSAAVANTAPGGITTNPSWNGASVTQIVTGQALAAKAVHVYRVTVVATVAGTITPQQADCTLDTGESGTGFLNRATVTSDGASQSDEDCTPPTRPGGGSVTIDKKLVSSTNTGGTAWQIAYDVTVVNGGTKAATYDLADALKYGAGITVNSAAVTNTAPGGIATNPSWNGVAITQIVTGQAIEAGTTHVYRITVTATVATTVTTTDGDCELTTGETGTGFLNESTLTVDGKTTVDKDCGSPDGGQVTIDKRLVSSTNTGGTSWQIVYDVTVVNGGTKAATYDLADALKYGAGITVNSAAVANTAPGSIATNPSWNGTSVIGIVSGQAIAAKATHVYRITVAATVATTTTTTAADCQLTTGETGSGFLNRASLTVDGSTTTDEDCGSPPVTPPSPPRPPKPPKPPLPVTGAGVVGMATVGFGLLLAGAAALLVSRRRRSDMGE